MLEPFVELATERKITNYALLQKGKLQTMLCYKKKLSSAVKDAYCTCRAGKGV